MPALKLDDAYATLTSTEGEVIQLNRREYDDIRSHLRLIQGGKQEGASEELLSTTQAAKILGISRRTLTRMLDRGEIPYDRYGNGHRHLHRTDVLRYQAEQRVRRHEALEEMRGIWYESGMDDDLESVEAYLRQFD